MEQQSAAAKKYESPPLNPDESSDADLDDIEIEIDELEDDIPNAAKKPHFLDYDNKPPNGYEEDTFLAISKSEVIGTTSTDLQPKFEAMKTDCGTWPKYYNESPPTHSPRHNSLPPKEKNDLCPKMECVYSLLSMLGRSNPLDTSIKFLELSKNRDTCSALRKSGCIPLLVQIIHSDVDFLARKHSCTALHNVILSHPDDKAGRREVRVLKLIEQLIDHCDYLKSNLELNIASDDERHPVQAIGTLMKVSFDEEHRHAMCQLGALQTISSLVQLDHAVHDPNTDNPKCITTRRYAGMILTNLTFGDGNNKALLCSNKAFMRALVDQIRSSSDELVQVTSSVLRNLSWRADSSMKQVLNEIGTVKVLCNAAMQCQMENTLKAILSALWNLSNHCSTNKSEFCEVEGSIEFLIDMLTYEAPSKTMNVIENAGGILRNVSSYIATREDYRKILRRKNCLGILLQQLKSPSLTIVSNACGTLGNLSAENAEDQKFLRDNGAIPMLRSLIYSKHKMISTGSSIALKNLLSNRNASGKHLVQDSVVKAMVLKELPTLNVRKQRALEQELDMKISASKPEDEKPVNYSLKSKEEEYQETDIDQITDYSLRYAENQSESDEEKEPNPAPFEDSVKSYYTEGTPRIISNATSMSDLRVKKVEDPQEKKVEPVVLQKEPVKEEPPKTPPPAPAPEPKKEEEFNASTPNMKSVTFAANFAEETPLMFSRTSSMGSLSSAEPNCTDDKSSIISDFSRLASGLISPSELPDSPTHQSTPHSPRRQIGAQLMTNKPVPKPRLVPPGPSTFDDNIKNFDVENTPAEFSCATSLSKLSMDELEAESKPVEVVEAVEIEEKIEIEEKLEEALSDGDESENDNENDDDLLLENCINVGMNYVSTKAGNSKVENLEDKNTDMMMTYCTENTPAVMSKIPSVSDLSALSLEDTSIKKDSDESSDENDQLLEECIRDGMPKSTKVTNIFMEKVQKENPIKMMRNPAHLVPYLDDEMNVFQVENTPCTFSARSVLSDITVESEIAGLAKIQRTTSQKPVLIEQKIAEEEAEVPCSNQGNDSLSSLSMESDDEILNQAIAAGIDSKAKNKNSTTDVTQFQRSYKNDFQSDDTSSIDSCDYFNDQSNSLLEQCIQSGMKKNEKTAQPSEISPNNEDEDEKLVMECIQSGMPKPKAQKSPARIPKNLQTYSASLGRDRVDSKNGLSSSQMKQNGFRKEALLSKSNEYPAIFTDSVISFSEVDDMTASFGNKMEISNEYIASIEGQLSSSNKHKDPELMLKSVERLTEEFVSTAEYLRTVSAAAKNNLKKTMTNSTNTWDEDTNPDGISFPSISEVAPKIQSFGEDDDETISDDLTLSEKPNYSFPDDEITPTNEYKSFSEKLEALKMTNGIHFKVGGEVKHFLSTPVNVNSFKSGEMTTSLIAEAKKVATDLQNIVISESAVGVDLDEIRPPFDASLSSEYFDPPSYCKDSRGSMRNASLMRRVLDTNFFKSGSVESINSMNNLENIAPPSIMNDLMDSMLSVASIASEIESLPTFRDDEQFTMQAEPEEQPQSIEDESTLREDVIPQRKSTPTKRQTMQERFKTYTIPQDVLTAIEIETETSDENLTVESFDTSNEEYSPSSPARKSIRQKRQENKSRYVTQIIESSNIVPNADIKPSVVIIVDDSSSQAQTSCEEREDFEEPKEETPVPKDKLIRGTKKPAYISPYRRTISEDNPRRVGKPPVALKKDATKTTTKTPMVKSKNVVKKETTSGPPKYFRGRSFNSTFGSRSSSKSSTPATTPTTEKTLVRQETFVKEEPTNNDVPVVTSAPSTPSKKPLMKSTFTRLMSVAKPKTSGLQKSSSMDTKNTPSVHYNRFGLISSRSSLLDYKKGQNVSGSSSSSLDQKSGDSAQIPVRKKLAMLPSRSLSLAEGKQGGKLLVKPKISLLKK